MQKRDCFAALAMTKGLLRYARNDKQAFYSVIARSEVTKQSHLFCHCEERSDEAISLNAKKGIASLCSQ
jgi:hypothetical protein